MSFIVGAIVLMLGLQLERRDSTRPNLIVDGIAATMVFAGSVTVLASAVIFVLDQLETFK